MSRKRVVVTGLSALTPLGGNVTETWDNLLAGKSGIGPITLFDASGFDSRIAGEVKGFDPEAYGVPAKQARRMDRSAACTPSKCSTPASSRPGRARFPPS